MGKIVLNESDIAVMVNEALVEAQAPAFYKTIRESNEVEQLLSEGNAGNGWSVFKKIGVAGVIMAVLNNLVNKLNIDKTKPFFKFLTSKVVLGIISYKIASAIGKKSAGSQNQSVAAVNEGIDEISDPNLGAVGGGVAGLVVGFLLREVLGISENSMLYKLLNPVLLGGAGAAIGAAIGANQPQQGGIIDKFRNSGVGNTLGLNQPQAQGMGNAPGVNYGANNVTYPVNQAYTTKSTAQPQPQQNYQQQVSEAVDRVFNKYFK